MGTSQLPVRGAFRAPLREMWMWSIAILLGASAQPAIGEPARATIEQSSPPSKESLTTTATVTKFVQDLIAKQEQDKTIKEISFNLASEMATDGDLEAIAGFASLEELDLTKLDIQRWPDGQRGSIQRNIGAPNITDAGVAHVAALPRLRSINLYKSKVTDQSCRAFTASKSLREIGLDGTRVSDHGLVLLGTIPTLKYVSVRSAHVSEQGVAKLQRMRPDVEVLSNYR